MRKWYPAAAVALAVLVSAVVYPSLPARVPTHWDLHGRVNGWASRTEGAFLVPAIMIGLWILFRVLPLIDPRRSNYARMAGAYDVIVNGTLTLLLLVHFLALAAMRGVALPMTRIVPVLVGAMFVLIGNVLPQARPNWFVGIRTPWTLSNDRVWQRTHRIGGYLFVAGGLAMIVSAAFPPAAGFAITLAAALFAGLGSVVYSYIAWKQETST